MSLELLAEQVRRELGLRVEPAALNVVHRDERDVVEVDRSVMAYRPRTDAARRRLARERRILALLAPRLSIPVPRPLGGFDNADAFDLRERVAGAADLAFHHRALAHEEPGRLLATWMSRTLAELHGAFSREELDGFALAAPEWPKQAATLPAGIEAHLEGAARDAALEVVAAWSSFASTDDVFVHGDFGSHNFTFDPTTGAPMGLFDFFDAGRGSRLHDFKFLPSYGEPIMSRVLANYAPSPAPRDLALFHAVIALSYLTWRAEDPIAHDTQSGRTREGGIAWANRAVAAYASAE